MWKRHSVIQWTFLAAVMVPLMAVGAPPLTQWMPQLFSQADSDDPAALQVHQRHLALNQVLFRDLQLIDLLKTSRRMIAENRPAEAFASLQRIFDQPEDSFVWDEDEGHPVSTRRQAEILLGNLPADWLRLYEQIYGGEAAQLLETAQQSEDVALYERVSRRFFHTAAGFEAVDWLATRHLERGEFGLAARTWDRLLNESLHQRRLQTKMLVKAALAHRQAGHPERAAALLARCGAKEVSFGSRAVTAREWFDHSARLDLQLKGQTGWPMFLGNSQRNSSVDGSVPLLKALWSRPIAAENQPAIIERITTWETERWNNGFSAGVANVPLALDDLIIFRGAEGIEALNLADGAPVWRHPCQTSLASMLPILDQREGRNSLTLNQLYVENSVLGTLASDGRHVYAVDALSFGVRGAASPTDPFGSGEPEPLSRDTNRLLALNLTDGSLAWSVGGDEGDIATEPLAGHFFLGPPLPVDGRLYAVTENRGQLSIVAMRPESGEVEWVQGIALVIRSIEDDQRRYHIACSPSYSDGVIVCPTELGLLVAVDAAEGRLLWTYHYAADEAMKLFGGRYRNRSSGESQGGFLNLPLIDGENVVLLPRDDDELHCLNLYTGNLLWKAPRQDAEYVATIWQDRLLVVGSRVCRALAMDDGRELWSARLGIPAGQGVRVGERYLLPLAEGIVANLDLRSGSTTGYTRAEPGIRPGNLVLHRDRVISLGGTQLTAFPQARARLEQVLANRSDDPQRHAEESLLLGELQLRLGELPAARASLSQALRASLDESRRAAAEDLMRELLYIELRARNDGSDCSDLLRELAALSQTPSQRGQYLMQLAESQLRGGDVEIVFDVGRELAGLPLDRPLPLLEEPSRMVSAAAWLPGLVGRLATDMNSAEMVTLHTKIDEELQRVLDLERKAPLEEFLTAFSEWPQAGVARQKLAELLIEDREFQRSELLLLVNRESGDPEIAANATWKLAELWDRLKFHNEAGAMLAELETRFAHVRLENGLTGRQYVSGYPRERISWSAARRRIRIDWPVKRVEISTSRVFDERLRDAYSGYRRRLTPAGLGSFELLERGRTEQGQAEQSQLLQVDKETGITVGTISIQGNYSVPNDSQPLVGHLLPIACGNELKAVSLLESGVVWSLAAERRGQGPKSGRPGPIGPTFCVFQTPQGLIVTHPANGRVLWQRNDLEPGQGLFADSASGIIGDEKAIVVFGQDRSSYTVFSTTNGAELRRGRLDVNVRHSREAYGRVLRYVTEGLVPRLRLWDPLTDRLLLDEELTNRLIAPLGDGQEFLLVQPDGRVRIIEGRTGKIQVEVSLKPSNLTNVNYVRAFRDRERYYFSLQRTTSSRDTTYFVNDTLLPTVHVCGDLYAVDAATSKILWKQEVPQVTILHVPEYRLPFLLALSRSRSRTHGGASQAMKLEIFDCQTGQIVGSESEIFSDRILQLSYDRDAGRLELRGAVTQIKLDFGPEERQWGPDGVPSAGSTLSLQR